jgi:hypothetical protein
VCRVVAVPGLSGWSNVRKLVRGVLLVGSVGLALHLVLPQIPGLEKSLRLVAGTSHPLVGAAFLAELLSELCYAELLRRSVGVIFTVGSSPTSRRLGRWFMLRLTVTGYGAAHRRTIDLPQRALEALRSHRKHQLEEMLRARSYEDSDLVFATRKGTPLDAQNIVNRYFKPLLKRTGLAPIRWHDLRHTCATLLWGRGVHPKLVQHLLGHASITMTLDRYSHWIPSMGRHAAEGMDKILG